MIQAKTLLMWTGIVSVLVSHAFAQQTQPVPGTPRAGTVPAVKTFKLTNGLTVAVVERKGVPLVAVNLLIWAGASMEDEDRAGIADMTASLFTRGTKTRSATQIAEAIEFLGGDLNSGAGWNGANVSLAVTSDKLAPALAV